MTVAVRRLRADLRAVLRAVEERGERVTLTRHGRPVAALVPFGALAALDLPGRMLPDVADVAVGLREPDPEAPGLGPIPAPAPPQPPPQGAAPVARLSAPNRRSPAPATLGRSPWSPSLTPPP